MKRKNIVLVGVVLVLLSVLVVGAIYINPLCHKALLKANAFIEGLYPSVASSIQRFMVGTLKIKVWADIPIAYQPLILGSIAVLIGLLLVGVGLMKVEKKKSFKKKVSKVKPVKKDKKKISRKQRKLQELANKKGGTVSKSGKILSKAVSAATIKEVKEAPKKAPKPKKKATKK